MKYVNAMAVTALLLAGSVGSAQEQKKVSKGKTTVDLMVEDGEEQALINIANICGDNLACYFSPHELAQAFGARMGTEEIIADIIAQNESDKYAAEDASIYQEVMAAEARAKARKEYRQAQEDQAKKIADQATKEVAPVKAGEIFYQQAEVQTGVEMRSEVTKSEDKVTLKKEDKKTADAKAAEAKKEADQKAAAKKKAAEAPLKFVGIQGRGYPIYASFVRNFRQCAPGCFPVVVSVNRPGAYSCHRGGRAIDVGGIICGGTKHMAIAEANWSGKFVAMKDCMKGKMKTLWHNQPYSKGTITSGHWDHAHFSNGCTLANGTRYY